MLTTWDPFAEMSRLQDELYRRNGSSTSFRPAVDIFEDKDSITVTAELPGLKTEDVHIDVENRVLTVRGERKLENEEKREGYHRVERTYGSFTRSFVLPETVNTEAIDAKMKDGLLTVKLPKREAVKPRRVAVTS